jgi:hypothetical protein
MLSLDNFDEMRDWIRSYGDQWDFEPWSDQGDATVIRYKSSFLHIPLGYWVVRDGYTFKKLYDAEFKGTYVEVSG